MSRLLALALIVLGAAACEGWAPVPQIDAPLAQGSACVSGMSAGQVLTVRLAATYDATSSYIYDGSFGVPLYPAAPSCDGIDGVTTGTVVSFTLESLESSGAACDPWLASFSPENVGSHLVISNEVPVIEGVTIATAYAAGAVGPTPALATRALYTPGGNPDAGATPRALPPLVVTRTLDWNWQTDPGTPCHDEWIATWEPAP